MQHVTMKSSHFGAWMMHLMLTMWGGALTGGLVGFVISLIDGDSRSFDVGLCAAMGMIVYIVCFLVYVFVRTALGYSDFNY
jgi:phosphotransferase system  glucose/maltose/N-acetylglucosamine-specific IIC component